jgi:DNA-binding CsgD family transcriptional regulator
MSKATPKTRESVSAISIESGTSLHEIISALLANPQSNGEAQAALQMYGNTEKILLDIDFKGARYLLIKMPIAERKYASLSPRELEIVRMVAQGHQNKVIAVVLNISSWTVCTHLRRIFAKLGVTSRAAMVARLAEFRGLADQNFSLEQLRHKPGENSVTKPSSVRRSKPSSGQQARSRSIQERSVAVRHLPSGLAEYCGFDYASAECVRTQETLERGVKTRIACRN